MSSTAEQWTAAAGDLLATYDLTVPELMAHLEAVTARGAPPSLVHAEDLVVALAAARGKPLAVRHIQTAHEAMMRSTAMSVGRDPVFVDDVMQEAWTRLLCDQPEPKLLAYGARGPLGGWLRTFTTRQAVQMSRRAGAARETDNTILDRIAATEVSQRSLVGRRYEGELREAVLHAFATLEPAERNLLRYVYLHGLTGDHVAAIVGVHRVTLSRRLGVVRGKLLRNAARHLAERLATSVAEAEGLLAQLHDFVDLSLRATISASSIREDA